MINNKDNDNGQFGIQPYDLEAQLPSYNKLSREEESEHEVHLRDYLNIILKRKWIIFFFLIAVMITTVILTFTTVPQYQSEVKIQIDATNPKFLDVKDVNFEERGPDYYQTQYEILKSRSLAKKVIEELNLDKDEDFIPVKSKLSTIKDKIFGYVITSSQDIISNLLYFINPSNSEKRETSEYNFNREDQRMNGLINILLENIEVKPIKDSRLVEVSFVSHSPKIAYKVPNAVAEAYIKFNLQSKIITTQQGREWLENQIKIIKRNLADAEEKLNQYISKNKIKIFTDKVDENDDTIFNRELTTLSGYLSEATNERIQKEVLYRQIKESDNNNSEFLKNPLILTYKENYADLEAEYFNLLKIYKPDFPLMMNLKSQMNAILMMIDEEKSNIISSIESDYKAAVKKETYVNGLFENMKKEMLDFQDKKVQYQILKREVETNKELYDNMVQSFKEISVSANVTATNIQILDKAEFPKNPFKPNIPLNILLSIVFGLTGGVGIAFLVEYFDTNVIDTKDIEKNIQLPAVGIIPFEPKMRRFSFDKKSNLSKNKLLKYSDKDVPITEVFRFISAYMLLSSPSKLPKTILITSPGGGEGKTTVCINTATVFSETGRRGLIIDADLRKPKLHNIFSVENSNGLSTFLSGNNGIEERSNVLKIIKPTLIKNLDVITSGPILPDPSILLGSTRLKELIDFLYAIYDFIIIDSAPILGLCDSIYLCTCVEGVILVAKAGKTHRNALIKTKNILRNINANILGMVLNGVRKNDLKCSCQSYQY